VTEVFNCFYSFRRALILIIA